jgi:hypothetical protein
MCDIQLSPLALALYAFNVQAVRLLCLFHEPKKTDFFEVLDFSTINCFFECFAASNRRRTSDSFDSLDASDIPGFWTDSSDGSKCPNSLDHSDSSEYSRDCTYLGMYRDAFSALLKYGPPIEQNILDHELVKALKVRKLSTASILTHHGAKLNAEAENIRADLVLANYCLYDWPGLRRDASGPEGLAGDIDWLFGERSKLISRSFEAKDWDGLERMTFWNTGARTLEVTLKMDQMDLELRKEWGCRSYKGRFWGYDVGVCNFWIWLILFKFRKDLFHTAECTTTGDSRKFG